MHVETWEGGTFWTQPLPEFAARRALAECARHGFQIGAMLGERRSDGTVTLGANSPWNADLLADMAGAMARGEFVAP